MVTDYFQSLFRSALRLTERLPLERGFASMEHVTGVLQPSVETLRRDGGFDPPSAAVLAAVRAERAVASKQAAGLNTVGMLLDRLTILAMKRWALVARRDSPEQAAALEATQVHELVLALAQAQPGRSSVNNKMTMHNIVGSASDFPSAVYGLFTTNLLLWESQEVLYNHDILALPCEELRSYLAFFSQGNLTRNAFIQACDDTWWAMVER